ncbi:glucosidase 2 subunit beta-like [Myzus persicae]|uniref:glucosidase 2 subunit beta-like n=1 Tax=Myzus persicae TaxID=13164 RepID=UPI000B938BE0|nr:glucosidase 2 subunit beta-like [Myzus persicae]
MTEMENFYLIITIFCGLFTVINCTSIVKPRGIAFERASLYVPDKDFSCFDGSYIIPFSFVNDDYCDCPDASDEPGTSACPNGTFHCANAGHTSLVIPSSRVNDGICDCCDGSDEWANSLMKGTCDNTCEELGRAAREEAERVQKIFMAGHEIRAQLIAKGKELRLEKQNRITELFEVQRDAELAKNNTLYAKETAEEIEKSALEKYKIMNDEKKRQENEKEKLRDQNEAFEIFNHIDTNRNNKIEEEEVDAYSTFDQNNDGAVSQDEKDYFMENKKEISLEDFMLNGWSRLKQLILAENVDVKETEHPADDLENDKQLEEGEDQDEDESETVEEEVKYTESEELDESQYDEETKLIVEEAKQARNAFEEADRKFRDLQREVTHLQESLNKDFGPEDEFAALDGECYELSDREYVYKLCLFDQITQRSKNGGSEVRLGTWNSWIGEPKYRTMLYDRGQHCWNGPQRSTHVRLNCGLEPALLSATEPNRCEYAMDFVVPAVCVQHNERPSAPVTDAEHDEL